MEKAEPAQLWQVWHSGYFYKNAIYIDAGSGNRGGSPELDSIEKFVFDK